LAKAERLDCGSAPHSAFPIVPADEILAIDGFFPLESKGKLFAVLARDKPKKYFS
jgi:hypothetical protein